MGDELKSCPWCDGPARVVKGQVRYWGECQNLDCGAELGTQLTEAEAIKAWNTRTETQSQAAIDELVGAVRSAAELVKWICERAAKIDHARYLESEGDTGKVNPEIDVLANAQFDGMLASYRDEFDALIGKAGGQS